MNSSETLLCGCTSGAIFVRPCSEPAALACARCECPLCRRHGRSDSAGTVLCPECHAEAQQESSEEGSGDDSDGSESGWTAGSGRHAYWAASGSDGEYEDMAGDEGFAPLEDGASPFADEDYAAFDAVSDYDKNADRGDGYDS